MNKIKTLAMALLMAAMLVSCEKELVSPEILRGNTGPDFRLAGSAYIYGIALSFTDSKGNDLVAPFGEDRWKPANDHSYWYGEVNPSKYTLAITFGEPCGPFDSYRVKYDRKAPYFTMAKFDSDYKVTSHFGAEYTEGEGKYYLSNECGSAMYYGYDMALLYGENDIRENPRQDSITYEINSYALFGDYNSHKLVTCWEDDICIKFNPEDIRSGRQYPHCTKAIFEGKEVAVKTVVVRPTKYRDYYSHFIDIVLDR
ncbi:MAG: hypothetical protein IKX60_03670 [Bacteroidales bacterium]|nr:hypothetical protein [Bacteroidales bacterium]